MKVKTSITLSQDAARTLDRLAGRGGNRSAIVEAAIVEYAKRRTKAARNQRDQEILNSAAATLNKELDDLLDFQADV